MCGGELVNTSGADTTVKAVIIDSRSYIIPEKSIFFALKGEKRDGHKYIPEIIGKGVKCIVAERISEELLKNKSVLFIRADNTMKALQSFAAAHRILFNLPVVAITGSNGKTIVKEWLAQLLSPEYSICRSPLSYNSQIGVPLSVLQLNSSHNLALFEAGISKPGEMKALGNLTKPTLGVFTGIGAAHDENFQSREEKAEEKLKLFKNCSGLVCFCEDPDLFELITSFAESNRVRLFTVGHCPGADIRVAKKYTTLTGNSLEVIYKDKSHTIRLSQNDFFSVSNTLLCLGTMLLLGYELPAAAGRLSSLEPVAMRMEQIEGIGNCIIINDSYNNDLLALRIALEHLSLNNARQRKCLILSDIFQSGLSMPELTKHLMELLNRYRPDKFIAIGRMLSSMKGTIEGDSWFYDSTEQFLRYHPFSGFRDEVILLKGARSFEFEKIRDVLQRQSHGTVLEINLGAVVHNLKYFRSLLPPETKIMAMVKAFAYGSGSFEIASLLQYQQVDYLAVAYPDEGVELRNAGITIPVMVMSPEKGSFDILIRHHLEPELFSFSVLNAFIKTLKYNYPAMSDPYPVHIEVNTGMNRLGFESGDTDDLISLLNETDSVVVKSVFSHLATATDASPGSFAIQQIETFNKVRNSFLKKLRYIQPPMFHILNSDGIINFPEAIYDMVRPGIGLYGFVSCPDSQKSLKYAGRLKAVITQIRLIKKGDTVGYNRSFTAQKDTLVATVGIGYADGFNRKLGNGNFSVSVNGKQAKVIGDVCMDMIMLDVTKIGDVSEGDEVIVFNDDTPVTNMSAKLGTIPYEILTSIPARVKRIFLTE